MEAQERVKLFGSFMEVESFVELYDSLWFESGICKRQAATSSKSYSEANQHLRQHQENSRKPEILRIPTTISRSMSEKLDSKTVFSSAYSLSPDSVLFTPKLKTILSGKESTGEEESPVSSVQGEHVEESPKRTTTTRRRIRGKKTASKSLSELEYDELKGFMDLGFVFSEEDKDSSLVSIIPGLQRLGKNNGSEQEKSKVLDGSTFKIARPYLSEAWEVCERKDVNPLMNWRIPALSNEVDMKDSLKWWAHTVASTVR